MGRGSASADLRIAVQSGDQLRRDALAAYLETLPDFTVVGRVADVGNLVPLCELQRPGILLVDVGRCLNDSVRTLRLLAERFPAARAILTYQQLTPEELTAAREAGVAAVVPYARGLSGLLSVLRSAPADVSHTRWNGSGLTARQREILLLVASGHNVSDIAGMLDVSPGTVENHKRRIYAKLNATSAAQAVARSATLGIIDRPPVATSDRPLVEAEPGRGLMAVVVGHPGAELDRVMMTLITHQLPVVREHCPRAVAQVHWLRWHRGPVVRVLVRPAPEHWAVAATIGRSAILVHNGPIGQSAMATALSHGMVAAVRADRIEDELVPVLTLAAEGYLVMDPVSTGPFIDAAVARIPDMPAAHPTLTAREQDILHSIGRNHTVRQTARVLGIAVKTVENAQGHLFRKLGVHNRAAALATAYALGLLQPTEALHDPGMYPV